MSDDVLKRARQALEASNVRRTQPAALDRSKVDDLLTRARAAAAPKPEIPSVAPPAMHQATAPRVAKVRLQMTCGASGRSFIAIAERHGDGLLLVGSEVPQPGGARSAPAELLSGAYRVDNGEGWACPLCNSRDGGWSCSCAEFPDALHCGGRRGRARYCACGRLEDRHLVEVDHIKVRGQSVAAATSKSSPARPAGPTNLPAIRGR